MPESSNNGASGPPATTLSLVNGEEHLDISALEKWLWDAACAIRGSTDAPKFKDFILPLVFYKRLSDVFDDEFAALVVEYGDEDLAHDIVQADHEDALKTGRKPIVRFYIPQDYSWDKIRNHPADGKLGEFVTDAMREVARLNPDLDGVVNVKDYNERQSGQRTLDDDRLSGLIEVLSRHRLGLKNAEPDILGRAYEFLLRKFAEGQGQSAGEFYTPAQVGWLMAHLLDPKPYTTVYDPTCGSGGLLIKMGLYFDRRHPSQKSQGPRLFGQELNPVTYAMAKINTFLHDYTQSAFALGDTFRKPGFGGGGTGLRRFDYIVANPMWGQKGYEPSFYENDPYKRFQFGYPPASTADWAWVQHIAVSLDTGGRAAIVLDTGAVSRGSGSKQSSKERDIRKAFVDEKDWIEGVVLLPENLFYNTSAPGIILLLNEDKPYTRANEIILINASALFVKGRPKNVLTEEGISAVADAFVGWKSVDGLSKVVTRAEVRQTDYNLSPGQYVGSASRQQHRSLQEIMEDLVVARREREEADVVLADKLRSLDVLSWGLE